MSSAAMIYHRLRNRFVLGILFPTFVAGLTGQVIITVPPGGSIQNAINGASNGDVILVNGTGGPSSSFAPFVVSGKSLSILATNPFTGFWITPGSGPSVRVTGLSMAQTVTIADVRCDHTTPGGPAVLVDQNAGAVRLKNIQISPTQPIVAAQYEGLIEARSSASLWLEYVQVQSNNMAGGSATSPHTQSALSGLFVDHSNVSLFHCSMWGMDTPGGNLIGGDGIRLDQAAECWVASTSAFGGSQGIIAGYSVHDIASNTFTNPQAVQISWSNLGTNVAKQYAVNNASTTAPFSLPQEEADMTSSAWIQTGLSPGQTLSLTVAAQVGNRAFTTLLSLGSLDMGPVQLSGLLQTPVFGREVGGIFQNTAPFVTIATGVLPSVPTPPLPTPQSTFSVTMSSSPSVIGSQITFQTILLAPVGSSNSLTFSSALPFVMR